MTEIFKHIHTHMRTIEQYYPHNDQVSHFIKKRHEMLVDPRNQRKRLSRAMRLPYYNEPFTRLRYVLTAIVLRLPVSWCSG
ncbi:hypothetical protein L596_025098 [Steinernema carpocapsae]|uniref:Uncharacterized protein n=1 Tax=Steinernema carpocapsae TaxID=34508 RepID=A0A4U5M6Y9_STECR|nr:hypothetical protein L596_025098 [Steinernema carpocapsae]